MAAALGAPGARLYLTQAAGVHDRADWGTGRTDRAK